MASASRAWRKRKPLVDGSATRTPCSTARRSDSRRSRSDKPAVSRSSGYPTSRPAAAARRNTPWVDSLDAGEALQEQIAQATRELCALLARRREELLHEERDFPPSGSMIVSARATGRASP